MHQWHPNLEQLRRIYFTEGVDITLSSQDSTALNNRVDSLTFQVRCLETEKKNACEERDKYSAQVRLKTHTILNIVKF